jgi:hypothetical protein
MAPCAELISAAAAAAWPSLPGPDAHACDPAAPAPAPGRSWVAVLDAAAAPAQASQASRASQASQASQARRTKVPLVPQQSTDAAAAVVEAGSDTAPVLVAPVDAADGKLLARARFQRQARCGGGHTMRSKRLEYRAERKGLEVMLLAGEAPSLPRRMRFTSAQAIADRTGGTCETAKGPAARRARRTGDRLYTIRAAGDGGPQLAVLERCPRPSARTANPRCQRAHRARSPDWAFSRQIYEARTKSEVQRQEIRDGLAAARALLR